MEEYDFVYLNLLENSSEVKGKARMNELGKEGWVLHLSNLVTTTYGTLFMVYTFKRTVTQGAQS